MEKKFRCRFGDVALLTRNELLRYIKIIELVDVTSRTDASLLKYYRFVQHSVSDNGFKKKKMSHIKRKLKLLLVLQYLCHLKIQFIPVDQVFKKLKRR